jgi:hypothetical protein
MESEAIFDGFEEALNCPAFASEPDEVNPRKG